MPDAPQAGSQVQPPNDSVPMSGDLIADAPPPSEASAPAAIAVPTAAPIADGPANAPSKVAPAGAVTANGGLTNRLRALIPLRWARWAPVIGAVAAAVNCGVAALQWAAISETNRISVAVASENNRRTDRTIELAKRAQWTAEEDSKRQGEKDNLLLTLAGSAAQAALDSATAAKGTSLSAERQADAAATANAIGRRLAEQQLETFRLAQRADLIHGFEMAAEPNQTGRAAIRLPLQNNGATVALNVRYKFRWLVPAQGQEPKVTEDTWRAETWAQMSTVFAREPGRVITASIDLDPVSLAQYRAGRPLYIWTRMRYCDVFGRPRWTNKCAFRVVGRGTPGFDLCGVQTDTIPEDDAAGDCRAVETK